MAQTLWTNTTPTHGMPDRPTDASYRLVCLTLCQLRPASVAMRCRSATCRVVMQSKETASERRRQSPTTTAPTAALKHTSVGQWRAPVLSPSTARRTAHDAAVAAMNTHVTQHLLTLLGSCHLYYWKSGVQTTASATGVLQLPDHVCGTHCQYS